MQDSQLLYFSEILFDSTYYKISEGNSQYFTPERSNKKNMYLKKKALKIICAYLEAQVFLNPQK